MQIGLFKTFDFFRCGDLEIPRFHEIFFYGGILRIEPFYEDISIMMTDLSWR